MHTIELLPLTVGEGQLDLSKHPNGVMRCEEEDTVTWPFPVSECLAQKLEEQLSTFAGFEVGMSGQMRYELARMNGALAAVARGVKNRKPEPNMIFIPKSEMRVSNGQLRISSLRASLPVPKGAGQVKCVVFFKDDDDGTWAGNLFTTNKLSN